DRGAPPGPGPHDQGRHDPGDPSPGEEQPADGRRVAAVAGSPGGGTRGAQRPGGVGAAGLLHRDRARDPRHVRRGGRGVRRDRGPGGRGRGGGGGGRRQGGDAARGHVREAPGRGGHAPGDGAQRAAAQRGGARFSARRGRGEIGRAHV